MSWDDFGGNNAYQTIDAFSGGSWSPQDYGGLQAFQPQPSFQGDIQSGTGMQYDPITNGWSNSQGGQVSMGGAPQPQQPQMGGGGNWFTNMLPMAGAGAGGAAGGAGAGGQQGGLMSALPGLLGAGGSLASVIGQLVGGGQSASKQGTLNNAGQGAMNSANSMNANAATGQLPLQQMQMSLLQALQSGQGLPPGYQQLIEQAFQPQMGDLYTQAAQMGQARGFHDAPATSPPGGAILGPGLANLQGQMAQAKLGLMQSLPQAFQNPINSQLGALNTNAQGLTNTAKLNSGETTQAPMDWTKLGNSIGGVLQGAGQAMGIQQNMGSTASLGGAPVKFAKGGIVTKPTNALIGEAGPEAVVPLGGKPGAAPPPGLMQLIMSLLQHAQATRATGGLHGRP